GHRGTRGSNPQTGRVYYYDYIDPVAVDASQLKYNKYSIVIILWVTLAAFLGFLFLTLNLMSLTGKLTKLVVLRQAGGDHPLVKLWKVFLCLQQADHNVGKKLYGFYSSRHAGEMPSFEAAMKQLKEICFQAKILHHNLQDSPGFHHNLLQPEQQLFCSVCIIRDLHQPPQGPLGEQMRRVVGQLNRLGF
uniref:Uncharacterized protein n=1 Tax=Nothobranchius furzeri TaxID=105023 RepID=A0A8C6M624_NOTFU